MGSAVTSEAFNTEWMVHPTDPACLQESIVGGKAVSLGRLCRMGVQVPPFVVVSTAAHRRMAVGGPDTSLHSEVSKALASIGSPAVLAVRSSAVGEDAADHSFAGLYHTSLGVSGIDAVMDAIEECWDSFNREAAIGYREMLGGDRADGAMAVILQQMIVGQWSGVCFTADPVSLALSRGVVNAVPGVGEALVSGEVNPEEIAVSTVDGQILSRQPGDASEPFPEQALRAVWQASQMIARQLGFPQDTEWTWRDGELFILQSRPITNIADVFYSRPLEPWHEDVGASPDDPGRLWSRMLADETWVSPISPLFYNVHNSTPGRLAFIRSHGDHSPLPPDIFKYHRATAYVDVRIIQRMYEFQPRIARIRGVQNFLPKDMQKDLREAPFRWAGRLRRVLSYEFNNRRMRSFFHNYRYVERQWPDYVAKSNRWLETNLDELSLSQLRSHQAQVQSAMAEVGPPCAIAVLSHASDVHLLLTGLLNRWCPSLSADGETLYARISSGLDGSETVRESEALWQFARRLRDLGDAIADRVQRSSWQEFRRQLAELPGGRGLVTDIERFWHDHRHLGSSYKDLIWPRWGDDIDLLLEVIKGYAASAAERPTTVHARSASARRASQAEILSSLRGPLAPLRRQVLRFLFKFNERYMAVRDNHRFYVDRNWYELRRIYRAYGRHLCELGILNDADDIFFLGVKEIDDGLHEGLDAEEAQRRIIVRKRTWKHTLREQGPKFLKGWSPFEDATQDGEDFIRGIAASPGSAVGTARVIYQVSELSSVRDGDILVTRQTDPSWTTVFGRIGALVLETGGVLSHGTSLCREYGLPCVTAVERATVRIPNGARIEVIGSEGVVRLLDSVADETS